MMHRLIALLFATAILSSAGCGGKYRTYPVEGRVLDAAGNPLPGLQLTWECEEPKVSATAVTDASGRYRLGTSSAADGAPLGTYRIVAVEPQGDDPDAPIPRRCHAKYASFDTTDVTFAVEKGANQFDIKLDAPE